MPITDKRWNHIVKIARNESNNTPLRLWTGLIVEIADELERLATLEAAIREHRDQEGDDRCWLDDAKLYAALGESGHDTSLPPKCEFLESCSRFWEQRQSPEDKRLRAADMTIAQLQEEIAKLREHREPAEEV